MASGVSVVFLPHMSGRDQAVNPGAAGSSFREQVLRDYRIAFESRQASLLGRKEVLTGKAKFGIFGDGKEVAQLAMARAFQQGDFRTGYYRDQTFMFAIGQLTVQAFFAQLYAEPSIAADPASAGRSMNGHFGTRFLDSDGNWTDLTQTKNSTSDISPTASQMARAVGLGYASKLFRNQPELLGHLTKFSNQGNEVVFATIGNASTSEGGFYEAFNAIGVLQVPVIVSVWDDQYGISVPAKYHTTKENISDVLQGFARDHRPGYRIFKVKGHDYPGLIKAYEDAAESARKDHVPALIHVEEMTQPQGHSTSGSHERYKSKERLAWEAEYDCISRMRKWMESSGIADADAIDEIEAQAIQDVKNAQKAAWSSFISGIKNELGEVAEAIRQLALVAKASASLEQTATALLEINEPARRDYLAAAHKALRLTIHEGESAERTTLINLLERLEDLNADRYNSHLYSESNRASSKVPHIPAVFPDSPKMLDGREIVQACFDAALARIPEFFSIGEDVGKIGDVNQGFAGLQDKYGEWRVTDTGIREWTIAGQGIGAAMRGLRPLIEIQYLDYFLYALQILSDDVSTMLYRTKGGQKCPLIVRTRGHRLEGIWHSGSPMGMILHALRGMLILVPRNMTQAAGFYNMLFQCDEPALVVECLNGYRLKEALPENLDTFTVLPGYPEILRDGSDVTLVTYGSCCRVAQEAATMLAELGVEVELIDVQSLMPFDISGTITASLKKTNKVVFLDEDVPGGATSFMLQQVLEKQQGWKYLDAEPLTITAKAHRPAYGSDGDYFSKPGPEHVFEAVYGLMHAYDPDTYPALR